MSDPDKPSKPENVDSGESSEPHDAENGVAVTKSKSGSVKFTEPLNDYKDLEDQYAEIMKDVQESGPVAVTVVFDDNISGDGDIVETIQIQPEVTTPTPENPQPSIPEPVPDEKPLPLDISAQSSVVSAGLESVTVYSTDVEESTNIQPSEYEPSIFSSTTTAATNASNIPSVTGGDRNDETQATPATAIKIPLPKNQQVPNDNGVLDVNLSEDQGGNDDDPFDAFEITPEDIFNEIKVAHAEAIETDGARNLHSYVISKTYSSENVVVLLNLRRLKDGEWVLDKTIAQGLKPETYGGIVSIDQYGVTETGDDHLPSRSASYAIHTTVNKLANTLNSNSNSNENEQNIMDVLRKMEEYVESVNKEIITARNLLKNIPACQDPCDKTFQEPSKKFDELSFTDQMIKIFNMLVSDDCESCNLCNENTASTSSQNPVSYWFQSLIEDISSLCGQKIFMWLPGMKKGSSATIVLSQSRGLLEQVRQSLSRRLSKNLSLTLTANKVDSNDSKADSEPGESTAPFLTLNSKGLSVDVGDIELQEIPGALELNIESKSDIEQILNEKQ